MTRFPGIALLAAGLAVASACLAQPAIPDATSSAPDSSSAIPLAALGDALRQGGYVIYFRHTATDFSKNDAGMRDYGDCANQRLLSEAGRETARTIGQRIRDLRLAAGDVLASPYCRTMDTARLMFGRAEPRNEIREKQGEDYAGLKRLLAAPVARGANRWIAGHGTPFRAVAGPPHLAEGEAAVLRPEGSRWTVVARVLPAQWPALSASSAQSR